MMGPGRRGESPPTAIPEEGIVLQGTRAPALVLAADLGAPTERWGSILSLSIGEQQVIGREAALEEGIVLEDPALSGRHAAVLYEGEKVWVRNLSGSGVTRVNGDALRGRERRELKEGDVVQCSWAVFVLRWRDPAMETVHRGGSFLLGISEHISDVREWLWNLSDRPEVSRRKTLITGETGTGKEVVADELLRCLRLRGRTLRTDVEAVNLGRGDNLGVQLFGAWRGSFTEVDAKDGAFVRAQNGVVLLDELGDLDLDQQAKLLRTLQPDRHGHLHVIPEGAPTDTRSSRVRIAASVVLATNRDLVAEVEAGRFREDLLYRISATTRHLLPLRDRREDIPLLLWHLLGQPGRAGSRWVSRQVLAYLLSHRLPGNARSLLQVVEKIREGIEGKAEVGTIVDPFSSLDDFRGQYLVLGLESSEDPERLVKPTREIPREVDGTSAPGPQSVPTTAAALAALIRTCRYNSAEVLRSLGLKAGNRPRFYALLDDHGVGHDKETWAAWARDRTDIEP